MSKATRKIDRRDMSAPKQANTSMVMSNLLIQPTTNIPSTRPNTFAQRGAISTTKTMLLNMPPTK